MTIKIEEHGSVPKELPHPVYRHSSETVRSENHSGGKVPVEHYTTKVVVRKTQ